MKREHNDDNDQFNNFESHTENESDSFKRFKSHDNDFNKRSVSEHRSNYRNKKSRIDYSSAQSTRDQEQDKVLDDVVCYHCDKTDHIRFDCSNLDKLAVTHVKVVEVKKLKNKQSSKNDKVSQTFHQRDRKNQ